MCLTFPRASLNFSSNEPLALFSEADTTLPAIHPRSLSGSHTLVPAGYLSSIFLNFLGAQRPWRRKKIEVDESLRVE